MKNDSAQAMLITFKWAILVSTLMMLVKAAGYFLTESAVIFADMSQSMVHIGTLAFAAFVIHYGSQPSRSQRDNKDDALAIFTKSFQGALIIFAGAGSIAVAIAKFIANEDIDNIEFGSILVVISTLFTAILGFIFLSISQRKRDLSMKNCAKLILVSSAISLGVIAALLWHAEHPDQRWIDQVIAIVIGIYTLALGISLLRRSLDKLIDKGDPLITRQLTEILSARCAANNIHFTDLKHVKTGDQHWVNVTLLFAPKTEIGEAHQVASDIEISLISVLSNRAHIVITMQSQKK